MRRSNRNDQHEPVQARHLEVKASSCGNDTEKMIRKFMKKVRNEGIIQEYIDRCSYRKPSVAKKLKALRARIRKS